MRILCIPRIVSRAVIVIMKNIRMYRYATSQKFIEFMKYQHFYITNRKIIFVVGMSELLKFYKTLCALCQSINIFIHFEIAVQLCLLASFLERKKLFISGLNISLYFVCYIYGM